MEWECIGCSISYFYIPLYFHSIFIFPIIICFIYIWINFKFIILVLFNIHQWTICGIFQILYFWFFGLEYSFSEGIKTYLIILSYFQLLYLFSAFFNLLVFYFTFLLFLNQIQWCILDGIDMACLNICFYVQIPFR